MHTCEHIVNQTMCRLHHCGRAVSAHIERKKSKLDFALPAPLTDEQVRQLEDAVNAVIDRHLDVTTSYLPIAEAAARFDLRRLPDGVSDTVRVVSIGIMTSAFALGGTWPTLLK